MPCFTGASNVIVSGGNSNSVAGIPAYYTTGDDNTQTFPDDKHNHQRPTVPDLEAACDDNEPFKFPQILQERISDCVPVENKPSAPKLPVEGDDAAGWSCHIHPEGWYYFFRQHHDELDPENINLHEIRGERENIKPTNTWTTKQKPSPAEMYGGLYVHIYVDHTRMVASQNKEALLKESYTDEEG